MIRQLSPWSTKMASHTAPSITVYSTPTCPDCRALRAWLGDKHIHFEERDLTDPSVAEEAKARTGVRVAPITIVGDNAFYGTFASQRPRLEELLGLKHSGAA
jgi:glutaredoxin